MSIKRRNIVYLLCVLRARLHVVPDSYTCRIKMRHTKKDNLFMYLYILTFVCCCSCSFGSVCCSVNIKLFLFSFRFGSLSFFFLIPFHFSSLSRSHSLPVPCRSGLLPLLHHQPHLLFHSRIGSKTPILIYVCYILSVFLLLAFFLFFHLHVLRFINVVCVVCRHGSIETHSFSFSFSTCTYVLHAHIISKKMLFIPKINRRCCMRLVIGTLTHHVIHREREKASVCGGKIHISVFQGSVRVSTKVISNTIHTENNSDTQ